MRLRSSRLAPRVLTGGLLATALALSLTVTTAQAAETGEELFSTPDELAVVVVGDGVTYANEAGPVAIQLVDSTGALGATHKIRTESEGDQHAFAIGVNRDQAGALQQSADHRYVTLGGYDASLGTADVNGTLAPEVLRVVARIDAAGNVDTSTTLDGAYSERHVRGVATTDGSRYWTGGHGNDSAGDYRAGVLTVAHGGDAPTAIVSGGSTLNNSRVTVIHEGDLFVSSDRSGYHGINAVASGLPTGAVHADEYTLIATAPAGSEVPHDFVFVGNHLYVNYTEGDQAIVRYALVDGEWVVDGTYAGEFWGITGRVAGTDHVLYATAGSNAGNELVMILSDPTEDFANAASDVLSVAPANTTYRGVAFAPGFEPTNDPIVIGVRPTIAWSVRIAGGSDNALSAVLGAETNPTASGTVVDPEGRDFTVTVSSDNQVIIADADITLTLDDAGSFILSAIPSAAGMANITLTVTTEDGRSGESRLSYWVSPALPVSHATAHVGMADASAGYDVGDGHFIVADDDSNALRLYGPTFNEPVAEFDFTALMAHPTDRTFDIEAAARIGDTIYWVGSLGNSRSGNYWPHRDIVFATTVSGSGADTTLSFAGEATGFRDALVAWDEANEHGAGAGVFQFERATTPGYSAEGPNSLNLEGATIAPDGTTLWLGFRSPLVPVAADPAADEAGDQALIIAIENIADVVAGTTPIVVSDYFTLDLDGRAIRDITETDDGNYLIAAGSADDSGNFAIYGWSGAADEAPVASTTPLGLDGWSGSYEVLLGAASLADGIVVRVLQDVGTVDIYGNATEAQDLTREFMKFVSHDYVLNFEGAFASPDVVVPDAPVAEDESSDDLANTGFANASWGPLALLLILAGGGFLIVSAVRPSARRSHTGEVASEVSTL